MLSYSQWCSALAGEPLPAALIDRDAFDRNVAHVAGLVRRLGGEKTMRLATKSLRVPGLVRRALSLGGGAFNGLMCFSAEEARYLHEEGFDDLLLAYPTVQPSDLRALRDLHDAGAAVYLVVDGAGGVRALADAMRGVRAPFPVLVDLDCSLRLAGGLLHLGVRRSPIRTIDDALSLCTVIAARPELRVSGLMAYEAQVAGLADQSPHNRLINPVMRLVRSASRTRVADLRAAVAQAMRAHGFATTVVNGGGSGSLDYALAEPSLTEVTMGSGLFCSHLFDHYSNVRFEPACFFALQVVRTSDPGFVTCQGGGYVASGPAGHDRLPTPHLPEGLSLVGTEGAGEVQTPLVLPRGIALPLGSPVLFRHAKAGELAERFDEYVLVSEGAVVGRAKTYRGAGRGFG